MQGRRELDPPSSDRAAQAAAVDSPRRRRRRGRGLPLSLVVVGGVIGLMVVAMALVIGLTFAAGLRNTTDLLIFSSQFLVQALENRIEAELSPAARLAAAAAAAAATGPIVAGATASGMAVGSAAEGALSAPTIVAGAMAVLPQAAAVVLVDRLMDAGTEAAQRLVRRDGSQVPPGPRLQVLLRDLAGQVPAEGGGTVWGPPVHVAALGEALLPVVATAARADGGQAAAMVLVSLDALRAGAVQAYPRGGRSFILYGSDHLLAAPDTPLPAGDSLAAVPLPRLAELEDPVFRAIGAGRGQPLFFDTGMGGFDGRYLDLKADNGSELEDMLGMATENYVVLTRSVSGFTEQPLTVGIYFRDEDVSAELNRLSVAAMAALAVLLVAAVLAYLLSLLITRPVRLFAADARRVAALQLDEVQQNGRPPSIREFRDAADAFGRMVNALRWFQSYVPRTLVQELLRHPDPQGNRSEERVVTVMFTDIRGFTALAERMPARQAAALLNAHFELVNTCVEAEGGTVDKYIGDSVMCFWGAPQVQEDHAARSMRAALAIRAGVAADNRRRVAEGEAPIALRIGVHTGRAIVGNIGSRSRVNYTLVGDVVNIANRLEALGKTLFPEMEVCILASDAVLGHCGEGFAFTACGMHALRGREGLVQVHALS